MYARELIFEILFYFISIAMPIQTIFNFTELLQYYTDWSILNLSQPGQGQPLIDNLQC